MKSERSGARISLSLLVSALVLLADQVSKALVVAWLAPNQHVSLIGDWIYLTYVRNPGAALGILAGRRGFIISVTVLAVLGMLVYLYRYALDKPSRWGLLFLIGGTLGNLVDRIRLGYVVDILALHVFSVVNLADIAISLGVVLLAYGTLRGGWEEVGNGDTPF